MLNDLLHVDRELQVATDVCVVGAGAAGVVLARNLKNAGREVCLLEAGGMDYENDTQTLFEGENIGAEYYPLDHSRLRFFGGTTNIWGGRNITLDPIDFKKRDWVPHSGWPISLDGTISLQGAEPSKDLPISQGRPIFLASPCKSRRVMSRPTAYP